MMEFNFDMGLLMTIGAVAALMIANTIFRIALSVKIGDFDWDELKRGLLKYLLTLVGVVLVYCAGELCPEAGVQLNGTEVSIDSALNIGALALVAAYCKKVWENISDLLFKDLDIVLLNQAKKNERGM